MRRLLSLVLLAVAVPFLPHAAAAAGPTLEIGVGRADITPPTGYFFQGWVESSALGTGVNTRLFARVIILKQGTQKYALVAEDLNGIAGGVLSDAVKLVAGRGFTTHNVIDSASHTHGAPGQYFNYGTYDTVFPAATSISALTTNNIAGALDPQLYAFEVRQLALAITRADDDLGPGKAAWGHTTLLGVTQNRSLEAHLADYGIHEGYGTGTVGQDPGGYANTIDPDVEVLRVDKTIKGKDYSVGTWMSFACHGTVNKATWLYYNADHHATADRKVEDAVRAASKVPDGQDVVGVYGNSDEGDQTAGIAHNGPADADEVGSAEAQAFMAAWKDASSKLSSTLQMDSRWTQVKFDGQMTSGGGAIDSRAETGMPLFTGSEEGRGPLNETAGQNFEGNKLPADSLTDPAQGDKIVIPVSVINTGETTFGQNPTTPPAVPLLVLRIGDRALASIPGEMTVEMGRRVRAAVLATVAGLGVTRVDITGLVNEYLSYFTTPEEYEEQHYEGGSMMYGRYSSYFLLDNLVALGKALAAGTAAPAPDATDPVNGVTAATAAAFGTGATTATTGTQPTITRRLQQATFSWTGGPKGLDMPVGSPFITIVRKTAAGSYERTTDDMGLQIYWHVDDNGVYTAHWEVPRDATLGTYAISVTANHYSLTSSPFEVKASLALTVSHADDGGVQVGYPAAVVNQDITARPAFIAGGYVNGAKVAGAGANVSVVAAGAALDAFGNCNGSAYGTTGTVTECPALPAVAKAAGGAKASSPGKTVSAPDKGLAATGLPVGLVFLALGSMALGAVARRRARA